jgi:superfamily II DNA or RNA helicase
MSIEPEAIEKFLAWTPPEHPEFKGKSAAELYDIIYNLTDAPYVHVGPAPYQHQLEGLAFALWQHRALLYFWMQLGKSRVALDWLQCCKLAGWSLQKGLIIAHSPVGIDVWEAQVAKHSNLLMTSVRSGPNSLDDFLAACENGSDGVIVAWSTLQQLFTQKRKSRKGVSKLYPMMGAAQLAGEYFTSVVIDEIHLAGNHTTNRFKIASALVQNCNCRLGLSGTPVGRDAFKLWASTFLIDSGETLGRNYYFFEAAFGKTRRNPFMKRPEVVFDKTKLQMLESRLEGRAMSYELSEVRKLNTLRGQVDLKMRGDQRTAYNDMVDKVIKIKDGETQEIHSAFVRLRQIASGFLPFIDNSGAMRTVNFESSAKLEWISSFLEEYDGVTQCVIFHEFIHSGQMICERLERAKISHAWLHGSTKNPKLAIESFQKGSVRFLVANTAKGGTSINLPMADYLLFYECPTSPTVRQQAESRPLARGDRVLLLDDLVCSPVERKILGYVQEGKDMLSVLLHSRSLLRDRE